VEIPETLEETVLKKRGIEKLREVVDGIGVKANPGSRIGEACDSESEDEADPVGPLRAARTQEAGHTDDPPVCSDLAHFQSSPRLLLMVIISPACTGEKNAVTQSGPR
jgi:hypothetical protein